MRCEQFVINDDISAGRAKIHGSTRILSIATKQLGLDGSREILIHRH